MDHIPHTNDSTNQIWTKPQRVLCPHWPIHAFQKPNEQLRHIPAPPKRTSHTENVTRPCRSHHHPQTYFIHIPRSLWKLLPHTSIQKLRNPMGNLPMIHLPLKSTSYNGYAYLIVYCYEPHPLIPTLEHPHSDFNKLHQLLQQFVIYTTNHIRHFFQHYMLNSPHLCHSQTQLFITTSPITQTSLHLTPFGISSATGITHIPFYIHTPIMISQFSNHSFKQYPRTYATPLFINLLQLSWTEMNWSWSSQLFTTLTQRIKNKPLYGFLACTYLSHTLAFYLHKPCSSLSLSHLFCFHHQTGAQNEFR